MSNYAVHSNKDGLVISRTESKYSGSSFIQGDLVIGYSQEVVETVRVPWEKVIEMVNRECTFAQKAGVK